MSDCERWLKDLLLKQGKILCDDVRAAAKQKGFTKSELKQARKNLGGIGYERKRR